MNKISELIVYNCNQFLVVNKPPGLPSQNDPTEDKSIQAIAEIYCKHKLHLINRIDRPASGLMLMAKNQKSAEQLSQQIRSHQMGKTYLAVVQTHLPKDQNELIHYLTHNKKRNKSYVSEAGKKDAREARLTYEYLDSSERYHFYKIQLQTGRPHQIRCQLAAVGSPIKGDVKYGFRRSNKDRSIHLHAWKLSFKHPVGLELLQYTADTPDDVIWNWLKQKING